MILRELTEKTELERIKVSGTDVGYQVLLGIIAFDLMSDAAYDYPLTELFGSSQIENLVLFSEYTRYKYKAE